LCLGLNPESHRSGHLPNNRSPYCSVLHWFPSSSDNWLCNRVPNRI
jgi:hypothetical protein